MSPAHPAPALDELTGAQNGGSDCDGLSIGAARLACKILGAVLRQNGGAHEEAGVAVAGWNREVVVDNSRNKIWNPVSIDGRHFSRARGYYITILVSNKARRK